MSLVLGLLICFGSFGLLWGAIRAPRRPLRIVLALIGVFVFLMIAAVWMFSTGFDQPKPGDSALVLIGGVYLMCALWSFVLLFIPVRGDDYRSRKRLAADASDLRPRPGP